MIFKHTHVRVTNGEWMLGLHNELIRVAWMLIIMDQTCDEGTKDIMLLKTLLHVAIDHEIVQSLHTIQDMCHTVIRVFFKVAHLELTCKRSQVFQRNVELIEEVVMPEDLEAQELQRVLIEHRFEYDCIELDRVQLCSSLLVELTCQQLEFNQCHELLLERINDWHVRLVVTIALRWHILARLFRVVSLESFLGRIVWLAAFLLLLLLNIF